MNAARARPAHIAGLGPEVTHPIRTVDPPCHGGREHQRTQARAIHEDAVGNLGATIQRSTADGNTTDGVEFDENSDADCGDLPADYATLPPGKAGW